MPALVGVNPVAVCGHHGHDFSWAGRGQCLRARSSHRCSRSSRRCRTKGELRWSEAHLSEYRRIVGQLIYCMIGGPVLVSTIGSRRCSA